MKKRWFSFILVICMLFGMLAQNTAFAENYMLYDDNENEYYANFLTKLGIYAFINEEDVFFNDGKAVLRYEVAKSLITLLGYKPEDAKGPLYQYFADVPEFYSEAAVIATAVNHGLMSGVGTGTFAPEGEMKVEHFLKALVVALGYEHEALARGGYPDGYIKIANRFGLLKNAGCSISDTLTRGVMVKILYNALDVDVCIPVALEGGNVTYRIEKDVNLLNYYHNITCIKEEVINSSEILSLKSGFEPKEDRVLAGDEIIYTDDSLIFDYAGYRADIYVKEKDDIKTLVYFEVCEDNEVYALSPEEVISADSMRVEFEDEEGKEETVNIANSAQIFLNGNLLTAQADKQMKEFSGNMTIIDNDEDGKADVVFIENFIYEKIDYINPQRETVYFESTSFDYSKKKIALKGETTAESIEEIPSGVVIGIAHTEGSEIVIIKILGSPVAITVSEVSEEYITSAQGESYYLSYGLDKENTDLLKPGKNIAIAVGDKDEIVWIAEEADAAKVGFLIKTATEKKVFDTRVMLKILGTDNVVSDYVIKGDKLRIDDQPVVKENIETYLINSKNKLNITADGSTSQVIYYVLNDAKELVSIYTAKTDESGKFMLSYNYKEDGIANLRDHGYSSAVFGQRNALTRDVPIFRVPLENIESYNDEYFNVTTYTTQEFVDGGNFAFDSYLTDESDIIPEAVVYYKTAIQEISREDSTFFLVEKITTAVDSDGATATKVKGYYKDKAVSYFADTSSEMSFEGVDSGDIITVVLDALNKIVEYELVYDLSTDTVNPDYVGESINDIVAVRVLHVYNAPPGSAFIKTYFDGFKNGVPGEEKAILFNFTPFTRTNAGILSYDTVKEEGKLMEPEIITDYCRDTENYTKIVVRYRREYQMEAVIYY